MKAVIISDTHGRFGCIQQVIEQERPFDMLLHAGDIQGGISGIEDWAEAPVYAVKGNCDLSGDLPEDLIVPFGSHRIFLTHGHRHAVRGGIEQLAMEAKQRGADIAVYGHTHISLADALYGVNVLNPGSLTEPRGGLYRPTYLVLETAPSGGVKWEIKFFE